MLLQETFIKSLDTVSKEHFKIWQNYPQVVYIPWYLPWARLQILIRCDLLALEGAKPLHCRDPLVWISVMRLVDWWMLTLRVVECCSPTLQINSLLCPFKKEPNADKEIRNPAFHIFVSLVAAICIPIITHFTPILTYHISLDGHINSIPCILIQGHPSWFHLLQCDICLFSFYVQ